MLLKKLIRRSNHLIRLGKKTLTNRIGSIKVYFKIALSGLIFILLYKLFPYNFPLINSFSIESIIHEFSQDKLSQLKDYFELLISLSTFSLLGFGLTGLLKNQRLKEFFSLLLILLASTGLGAATEVLQALSSARNPNLLDVFTDTVGGLVGWFCFCQFRFQFFQYASTMQLKGKTFLRSRFSLPVLAAGFIGYFLLAAVGMVALPTGTDLSNWDSSFPLLLGNEFTGNRPWQGSIEAVQIFDQALPEAKVNQLFSSNQNLPGERRALLASYEFTHGGEYFSDQTGQLPKLSWTNSPTRTEGSFGVSLSAKHWLHTYTSATYLNDRIKQSAQLTLDITVQSDNPEQRGPARILSLSKGSVQRNLTVGQEGKNLVLRLRTPLTGTNGSNPEMIIPQVFTDSSPHHLVMTYVDSTLRVYIDKLENLYTFKIPYFGYQVLYYGGIFTPLASLLGLIWVITRGRLPVRIALLVSGVALPTLLLEGLLASTDHRSFSPENLVISLVFMIGTLLIVRGQAESWLKSV